MQANRIAQIVAAAAVVVAGLVVAPALADALYRQPSIVAVVPGVDDVDPAAYTGLLPGGVSFVDVFVQ